MKKSYLCLIVFISVVFNSKAQEIYPNLWELQKFSPQVSDLIRYDNIPVLMNTGRIDLSVPVMLYKDRDFDFPITLNYNSEGFKPGDPDNYVGRNWSINLGGVIYREVRGIPDDVRIKYTQPMTASISSPHYSVIQANVWSAKGEKEESQPQIIKNAFSNFNTRSINDSLYAKGFLHIAKGRSMYNLNKDDIFNNPKKYFQLNKAPISTFKNLDNIEASSDIYRFNFLGHSGKFMIDYDGSVMVISNTGKEYKVNISNYQFNENTGVYSSMINIITDDGYTYYFGGSYASMEYMALSWERIPGGGEDIRRINQVTAFHLSRIVAPNGRELHINYMDIVTPEYHKFPSRLFFKDRLNYLKSNKFNHCYTLIAEPVQSGSFIKSGGTNYGPLFKNYILNKIALIRNITVDKYSIKIN